MLTITRAKLAHTEQTAKLLRNSTLPGLNVTFVSNVTEQNTSTIKDLQINTKKPTSLMTPWTEVLQNPAVWDSFLGYPATSGIEPLCDPSISALPSPPGLPEDTTVTIWILGECAGKHIVKVSQFKGCPWSWTRSHLSQCKQVVTSTKVQFSWKIRVWNSQLLQNSTKGDTEVKKDTFNVFRPIQSSKDIFLRLNTFHLCLQGKERNQKLQMRICLSCKTPIWRKVGLPFGDALLLYCL